MNFNNLILDIALSNVYPVIKGLDGLYHKCTSVEVLFASGSDASLLFYYIGIGDNYFSVSGTFDNSDSIIMAWVEEHIQRPK